VGGGGGVKKKKGKLVLTFFQKNYIENLFLFYKGGLCADQKNCISKLKQMLTEHILRASDVEI